MNDVTRLALSSLWRPLPTPENIARRFERSTACPPGQIPHQQTDPGGPDATYVDGIRPHPVVASDGYDPSDKRSSGIERVSSTMQGGETSAYDFIFRNISERVLTRKTTEDILAMLENEPVSLLIAGLRKPHAVGECGFVGRERNRCQTMSHVTLFPRAGVSPHS